MPHRVHAAMHVVEAASRDFAKDLVLRKADGDHLLNRDDPVLPPPYLRNTTVTSWFLAHTANKGEVNGGSPPGLGGRPIGKAEVADYLGEHLFVCVESR